MANLMVAAAAVAAVALLPVLIVVRYALLKMAGALYQHYFTGLGSIPEPPLPFLRRVSLGHGLLRLLVTANSLDSAAQLNEWRAEHGPMYIVRSLFGAPTVICMSVEGIRRVTLQKPLRYNKLEYMRRMFATLIALNGILLAEGAEHTAIRRAVAPSLHREALLQVDGVFREEGKRFCARLQAAGEDLDVYKEAGTATFRVILRACFGESALTEEQISEMREAYLVSLLETPKLAIQRVLLQTFLDFLIDPYRFDSHKREKRYLHDMIYRLCETVDDSLPSPVSVADSANGDFKAHAVPQSRLLSLMVDKVTKRKISHTQMVETVMSFMGAGQATTSISVSWTLYLLCRHPEWQRRLREELDNGWTENSNQDEVDSLPVMHRILKESLRLYPPANYPGRMLVEPDVVDGVKLPKGTIIRFPILAIHRDEHAWGPDASEFRPDRFLPEEEAKRSSLLWCPFLFGSRGCIGKRFAMLEMKTLIAHVISKLEVFVDESKDPPPQLFGSLAYPRNMRLYVRPRGAS